jgi:hypothetical protein
MTKNRFNCNMYIVVYFLAIIPCTLWAQKKKAKTEAATAVQQFIQVSNLCQNLPVYSQFEVKQTTNIIQSQQDTATVQGHFYLNKNNCYIRLGDLEQIMDDSVTLVVSNEMQRMFVHPNSQPMHLRIKMLTGMAFKDSTIQALDKNYKGAIAAGESKIILTSREVVQNSSLPKETIELKYDDATMLPIKIVTIKRKLFPIQKETYDSLLKDPENMAMVFTIEGKKFFLIKEQRTSFWFKEISHKPSLTIAARIKDRLTKGREGEYIPVQGYETYSVSIN